MSSKNTKLFALSICRFKQKFTTKSRKRTGWTLEKCLEDASQYNSRADWHTNSPNAYGTAQRHNWLLSCCRHMKTPPQWNHGLCKADARRYRTRESWKSASPDAYHFAQRHQILNACCEHMTNRGVANTEALIHKDLLAEECRKDALKYACPLDWFVNSRDVFLAAKKLNILDECYGHMVQQESKHTNP